MGRAKQPISLLEAKGKKHLTKTEILRRKNTEVKANNNKINIPSFLTKKYHKEFNEITEELYDIGIMSNLDVNVLAQYLLAKNDYIYYTKTVNKLRTEVKTIENLITFSEVLKSYEMLKDKAFKQCQVTAASLGLTISSRCKLVLPAKKEEEKENKFSKFNKSGAV